MGESLGDISFATKLRDLVVNFARSEVQRFHPPATYGEVIELDRRALVAQVLFPGAPSSVPVRMGAVQPQQVGQKVRVCPKNGDLFLEDVIGPAYFVGIAGTANSVRNAPLSDGGSDSGFGAGGTGPEGPPGPPGGRTILYGLGAPTTAEGADGDFYIDISDWIIYGPRNSVGWPVGTTMRGPAGTDGVDGTDGTDGAGFIVIDYTETAADVPGGTPVGTIILKRPAP